MAYADFRHRMSLRVRWAEVDRQGVVFNGHYLLYCDVCITEYWRTLGMSYPDDFLALGCDLYVRKATLEYHSAAFYDDELEVCGRIARLGNTSLRFVVEIYRRRQHEARLIDAELVYVCADPAKLSPVPVPASLRARVREFETLAPDEAANGAG
jgi:acyl-CoA thioester hydrolase